jgi:thiamine-monophosphate kinase
LRAIAAVELTEDALVAAIVETLGTPPRGIRLGIGDDAAAWQPDAHHLELITGDMLVDGVHFRSSSTDPGTLGHKALAKSLSDVAAMAGRPLLAIVALGVTHALDEAWIRSFYRGMASLAGKSRCSIAGGDIVRAPVLTIAVTVVGDVRRTSMRTRSAARAGDLIAVTGPLGLGAAGLRAVDAGDEKASPRAAQWYLKPQPRLAEGAFFGSRRAVHAMMDISDGVSTDLARMARASHVDAVVSAESLFVHPEVAAMAAAGGTDAERWVLSGGDDYELLVTVDSRAYAHVAKSFERRFGRPLCAIGRCETGGGAVWIERNGRRAPLEPAGYDHLKT